MSRRCMPVPDHLWKIVATELRKAYNSLYAAGNALCEGGSVARVDKCLRLARKAELMWQSMKCDCEREHDAVVAYKAFEEPDNG